MKKVLLLLFVAISSFAYSQQSANGLIYNCMISNDKSPKVIDTKNRKIYKDGNNIIITKYDDEGRDLRLKIDSVVNRVSKLPYSNKSGKWYYCTRIVSKDISLNYIVLGLNTSTVRLYNIFSEVEVFEEMFSALK